MKNVYKTQVQMRVDDLISIEQDLVSLQNLLRSRISKIVEDLKREANYRKIFLFFLKKS